MILSLDNDHVLVQGKLCHIAEITLEHFQGISVQEDLFDLGQILERVQGNATNSIVLQVEVLQRTTLQTVSGKTHNVILGQTKRVEGIRGDEERVDVIVVGRDVDDVGEVIPVHVERFQEILGQD